MSAFMPCLPLSSACLPFLPLSVPLTRSKLPALATFQPCHLPNVLRLVFALLPACQPADIIGQKKYLHIGII